MALSGGTKEVCAYLFCHSLHTVLAKDVREVATVGTHVATHVLDNTKNLLQKRGGATGDGKM